MHHRLYSRNGARLFMDWQKLLIRSTGSDVKTFPRQNFRNTPFQYRLIIEQPILRVPCQICPQLGAIAILVEGQAALFLFKKDTCLVPMPHIFKQLAQLPRFFPFHRKNFDRLALVKIIDCCPVIGNDRQGDAAFGCNIIDSIKISSRSDGDRSSCLQQSGKKLSCLIPQGSFPASI